MAPDKPLDYALDSIESIDTHGSALDSIVSLLTVFITLLVYRLL